jgi:hypothetical protein
LSEVRRLVRAERRWGGRRKRAWRRARWVREGMGRGLDGVCLR